MHLQASYFGAENMGKDMNWGGGSFKQWGGGRSVNRISFAPRVRLFPTGGMPIRHHSIGIYQFQSRLIADANTLQIAQSFKSFPKRVCSIGNEYFFFSCGWLLK